MDRAQTSSCARRVSTHALATRHMPLSIVGIALRCDMSMKKGTEMTKAPTSRYQGISSDSDKDQDVHMYSGPTQEEPRSVDADSAISSCSGSPSTPSIFPFFDPASRFNGRSPETTRPSVIVASANLDRSHGSPSSEQRLLLPPPDGVTCQIVTQPKPLMRFRYSSEYKDNRAAHKMVGEDSTTDRTTYPSLFIKGWNGPAVVIVSLLQDKNYQLHPHSLVVADCDKDTEQDGFVRRSVECNSAGTLVLFNDLCLIRNKKESVLKRLPQRYRKIDPFGVGYHSSGKRSINSHAVRLCFEVYMQVEGRCFRLAPVVSNVVRNSGAHQTLKILNLAFCPVRDHSFQEVILLCDKVDKDDIQVEVLALDRGKETLHQLLRPCDVHGQVAIIFKVPSVFLSANDNLYVRLRRISTQDKSELYKFTPPLPVREHVAGTPTTSPGGTLEPPAMFCNNIPISTSHLMSREPIQGPSALDGSQISSLEAANKFHSTHQTRTSAYNSSRHFGKFHTNFHTKDILMDLNRLNGLSINTPCQTTGQVNYEESTKETAYKNLNQNNFNGFSKFSYPKNYANVGMAGFDQSPSFKRNSVFKKHRTPALNSPKIYLAGDSSNAKGNILDDDKEGSSGEISDLISSETLGIVEKAVLDGVNVNTVYDLCVSSGEVPSLPSDTLLTMEKEMLDGVNVDKLCDLGGNISEEIMST